MPRESAVGKWNLERSPDEFYETEDPFKVRSNFSELEKVCLILACLKEYRKGIDIGCGEGHWTWYYAKRCQSMDACDISSKAVERARRRYESEINFFVHDITEPLKRKYDLVLFNEVLYYIKPEFWHPVARNIADALEDGGHLIITIGQYFTVEDIQALFPLALELVAQRPDEKYGYAFIMKGIKSAGKMPTP